MSTNAPQHENLANILRAVGADLATMEPAVSELASKAGVTRASFVTAVLATIDPGLAPIAPALELLAVDLEAAARAADAMAGLLTKNATTWRTRAASLRHVANALYRNR